MSEKIPLKFTRVKILGPKWLKNFRDFYKDCLSPSIIKTSNADYFAAYLGKIMVGHAALVFENNRYMLEGLRVRPEFREMGIGTELTRLRLARAVEKGAKKVFYRAVDKNLVSICCHMKFGFKKVCKSGEKCRIGEVIWYELDLTDKKTVEKILNLQLR